MDMTGSAIASLKDIEQLAAKAQKALGAKKTPEAIDRIIGCLSAMESALDAIQMTTGAKDHGTMMSFTALRGDLRLWKHHIEDKVRESIMAAGLAAEVLEQFGATEAINELVIELLGRGLVVAKDPGGQPNRKEGIYVGDLSAEKPGDVFAQLVIDGVWHESAFVNVEGFLARLRELPKGLDAQAVWDGAAVPFRLST